MRILAASTLVLAIAVPSASAAQKETETVDRTVSIGDHGRLKLRNFSGDVRITGTTGGDVVIHAVRRGTRERLANIKLEIEAAGSSVSIEANHRNSDWKEKNENVVETTFDVKVPYGTQLDVYCFSGKVEIQGVTGDIEAETFSGRIGIDVAAAERVPEITAETFSGDIEARVPASASGNVRFNSFSGSVESDLPISMSRRRGGWNSDVNGQIGSGTGPTLRFKTFSGDLRIRR